MSKLSKQIQEENIGKKKINCTCGCEGTKDQSKNDDLIIGVKNTSYDKRGENCC